MNNMADQMKLTKANNGEIAQLIRDDIVQGTLSFGARITINDLATRYGVSHMPVREALRELQGEGLVVIKPNHGAHVCTLDLDFIENLFELRSALEVMLARRAAQRCAAADVDELVQIENELEAYIEAQDYPNAIAKNHKFHQAINRIADNKAAIPIVDKHWTLLAALWRNYGYAAARFLGVANDHRHLIEALAANDQEAASMIMGSHVAKSKLQLLARVKQQSAALAVEKNQA
jgi:DNA-binding GntR family transcriptional regulator